MTPVSVRPNPPTFLTAGVTCPAVHARESSEPLVEVRWDGMDEDHWRVDPLGGARIDRFGTVGVVAFWPVAIDRP